MQTNTQTFCFLYKVGSRGSKEAAKMVCTWCVLKNIMLFGDKELQRQSICIQIPILYFTSCLNMASHSTLSGCFQYFYLTSSNSHSLFSAKIIVYYVHTNAQHYQILESLLDIPFCFVGLSVCMLHCLISEDFALCLLCDRAGLQLVTSKMMVLAVSKHRRTCKQLP